MFENQTYESILQRMLDRVSDSLDKREGSVIWDTHSPTALEFQNLYLELENMLQEAYGDTASREFLIRRAKERGITPYSATNAILKGEFTPKDADVLGKRFNLQELNYVVTEKIADGTYRVECETEGAVGNQYLGGMIPIEYIDGLETAELTAVLIPGKDAEETEALRKRYFASFTDVAYGGNRADYIAKTNGIHGVGATKVTRVWNSDLQPATMIPGVKVKSWYDSTLSTLDPDVMAWLKTVYTAAAEKKLTVGGTVKLTILNSDYSKASGTLIQTVQTAIDPEENAGEGYGLAPIGHVVKVDTAAEIKVNVNTSIVFNTGYSWSNLQSSIENAISGYLLELRKEWADNDYLVVRISQIESRIMAIQGVIDIFDTKINGNAANLTLTPFEIPVFGGAGA